MRIITFAIMVLCSLGNPPANAENLIQTPFSVSFDSIGNRYLVSSTGNNRVVAIDEQKVQSVFLEAEDGVGHLHLDGDDLYVVWYDGAGLSSYDRVSGAETGRLAIPGAALAGMTTDTSGHLYVANQYGSVLQINRSDLTFTTFASGLYGGPQGVAFDEVNNRIIACAYDAGSTMWSVDISDGTKTVFAVGEGHQDGITIDNDGNILTTAFWWQGVYGWDSNGNSLGQIATGLDSGPKGLNYNRRDNVLAVPLYFADSVAFLSFGDHDGDEVRDYVDNCPETGNPDQIDTDYDLVGDSCDNCVKIYNPEQLDSDSDNYGDACDICGDANNDNGINIGDVVYIANYVFKESECAINPPVGCTPKPYDSGDVNCDGSVNIGDAVYLGNVIFRPASPGPCAGCS